MAKKKHIMYRVDNPNMFVDENKTNRIESVSIGEYNTEHMKKFGSNVIMARFLPQGGDGLKPVERRILYSLYTKLKNKPKKKAKIKMNESVAACLNIHPHGDASVYSTTVRLGQSWQNMIPTIATHDQNFGTIKGDGASGARYLSVSLSDYAMDCFFSDFDPELVDMVESSVSEDYKEPMMLPAKYPNVLINGTTGVAWGIATNIPFYNVKELLEYTIRLIDNPDQKGYLVPDTPTNCIIIEDKEVFKSIHEKGTGTYKMRSEMTLNEEKHTITISSIPFQTDFEKLKQAIIGLKDEKVLSGLINMEDNSGGEHIDLILTFKKEVNLHEVKTLLTNKKFFIEQYYPVQIKIIDDLTVKHLSVRGLLLHWLGIRRDYKEKYYHMKLVKAKAEEHVLEIILEIFNKDNAEKTLKIIRKSSNNDEIVEKLVKEYDITSIKARAIANMRLSAFSKDAIQSYKKQAEEIKEKIKNYKKFIKDHNAIDNEIKEELREGIKKYGVPRESIIQRDEDNVIPDTDHVLVITKEGRIKKLPDDIKKIGTIATGDKPLDIIRVNNYDKLVMFDSLGLVYTLKISDVRGVDLSSIGLPINSFVRAFTSNTKIVNSFVMKEDGSLAYDYFKSPDESYFIFSTKMGLIKKTAYKEYTDLKQSVVAINLNTGDEVVSVQYANKDRNVLVYTYAGYGSLFNTDSITETKRMSKGVRSLELIPDDGVKNTAIIGNNDSHVVLFTERGYCKRMGLDLVPKQDRRSDGYTLINLDDGDLLTYVDSTSDNNTFRVYMSDEHFDVNSQDIPEMYRLNKGRKIVPVKRGDHIIRIDKF